MNVEFAEAKFEKSGECMAELSVANHVNAGQASLLG
jgi:hypothetical protein